jgi:HEPN domain-containing protein
VALSFMRRLPRGRSLPRPDGKELAERLLGKAEADQAAMHALADAGDISDSIIGFHAQQSAEKALKAVLTSQETEYPWTHDLRFLIELLEEHGVRVSEAIKGAPALTPWATEYRYGEAPDATLDRTEVARLVAAILDWARETVRSGSSG